MGVTVSKINRKQAAEWFLYIQITDGAEAPSQISIHPEVHVCSRLHVLVYHLHTPVSCSTHTRETDNLVLADGGNSNLIYGFKGLK